MFCHIPVSSTKESLEWQEMILMSKTITMVVTPSTKHCNDTTISQLGNSGQNGTEHKSMGQNRDLQEQSLLNYHE